MNPRQSLIMLQEIYILAVCWPIWLQDAFALMIEDMLQRSRVPLVEVPVLRLVVNG